MHPQYHEPDKMCIRDRAKTVARAIYEKKEIPSGVILGTSIGGLAVCAAVAVGFMVLWLSLIHI